MEVINKIIENKEVIAVFISTISVFIASFSKFDDKVEELQDKYYYEFLPTYFEFKIKNKNLNTVKYIKKYKLKDRCIPYYILYLADKGRKEDLEKVLIVDYRKSCLSLWNNSIRALMKSLKKVYYILSMAISVVLSICISISIVTLIGGTFLAIKNSFYLLGSVIWGIVLLLGIPCLIMYLLLQVKKKTDIYSVRMKTINNIIKSRLNDYDEKEEYYI